MIFKTVKIGLFVVALCSTSFVMGQERQERKKGNPEDTFKKLDADANGSVSLEEFKAKPMKDASREAKLNKHFEALDTNTDGELSLEEFRAKKEELMQQRFQHMDSDGNGTIAFSEYRAFVEQDKEQRRPRRPRGHKTKN